MHFSPTYARRPEDVATMVATRPGRATTPAFPTLYKYDITTSYFLIYSVRLTHDETGVRS